MSKFQTKIINVNIKFYRFSEVMFMQVLRFAFASRASDAKTCVDSGLSSAPLVTARRSLAYFSRHVRVIYMCVRHRFLKRSARWCGVECALYALLYCLGCGRLINERVTRIHLKLELFLGTSELNRDLFFATYG